MRGIGKKGAMMAAPEFDRLFSGVSKAALIDALWCACQLGTDESTEQIAAQAARNVVIALKRRADRVPVDIQTASARYIDSDGERAS